MNASVQVKPNQIYIFSGEDEYLLVQDARSLVNKLIPPEEQTLGLEIIEGQSRNAAEAGAGIVRCIEALRTPGFMGARKAIWLKGANFLDRSIIARSREVTEMLGSLTGLVKAGLPAGNILVVTANAVDKAAGFFKACHAKGEIHQQEELKPWQKEKVAMTFTRELLQKNKLQASQDVVAAIVDLVGTDSRQLSQEVNKLAVFIYPGQKTNEDDVRTIVSAGRESEAMHLADAVGARNLPKSIVILRQLLFQKENPIGIIMALESRFRYLFILHQAAGEKERDLSSLLASDKGRPMHPYFLSRLTEQAKLFSGRELSSDREAILETRLKLVSSTGLEKILLEKLLVKLCGRRKSGRRLAAVKQGVPGAP